MKTPISLTRKHILHLEPRAPFHFDATLYKPDHLPSMDNAWSPGVRWQTMRWRGVLLGLKIIDAGSVEAPGLALHVYAERSLEPEALTGLSEEIIYRYNLALDLRPFYARFRHDPQLGAAIRHWRGMRPASPGSLYEYLMIAILLQNAVIRRSIAMMRALLEAYGTPLAFDGRFGHWKMLAVHYLWEDLFWSHARDPIPWLVALIRR